MTYDISKLQSFFFLFSILQVAAAYFAFLEILFSGHLCYVLNLDKTTFMFIVGSLESGLKDLSERISSQVCKTLHIF